MSSSQDKKITPVCLISIDGWGLREPSDYQGNAVEKANAPTMKAFQTTSSDDKAEFLHRGIEAHGLAVGLPDGLMGNSEVGHLTMGMGRVKYNDLMRINMSIEAKTFASNDELVKMFSHAKANNNRIHMLGLLSDGGVHSHIDHLQELVKAAKSFGIQDCFVHAFGDGRDTPPTSATGYLEQQMNFHKEINYGCVSSIVGRYFAMDRDTRWERIKIAYDMLIGGVGDVVSDEKVIEFINERYNNGENDEFLKPIIMNENGLIQDGDTVLFFDYRADRMRQIVETIAFTRHFEPTKEAKDLYVVGMTQYKASFNLPALFGPQSSENVLAEWISKAGLKQFHTAETEKYAHVTFFFNGGTEKSFDGEERKLVSSPSVATYDLKPEMSASEVADVMVEAISKKEDEHKNSSYYKFIMCNFAPPDMVGHTGMLAETITAVEATDKAVKRVYDACVENGVMLVITSDHGNCEEMHDENGNPKTAHTNNLVPLNIIIPKSNLKNGKKPYLNDKVKLGGLQDVAPTVLSLMGLEIPKEMTGNSLVEFK